MALKRLTDIGSATGVTLSDFIHIVITGDTSQDPAGSSYKASLQQVYDAFSISNSVFTGNTSATCITDLYVSNVHSCSPLYINPLSEGDVYVGSANTMTIDLSNERVGIRAVNPTSTLQVGTVTSTFNINGDSGIGSTFSMRPATATGYVFDVYSANYDRPYIRVNRTSSTDSVVEVSALSSYNLNGTSRIGFGSHFNGDGALMVSRENITGAGTQGLFFWTDTLSSIDINSVKNVGHARPYLSMTSYSGSPTTYLGSVLIHSNGDSFFNGGKLGIGTSTPTAKFHVKGVSDGATLASLIQNSGSTNLLSITDNGTIAIGLGAVSSSESNVSIGTGAQSLINRGVAIGNSATSQSQGVSIGHATSTNDRGVAIGYGASSTTVAVAIGESAVATSSGVSIGSGSIGSTGVAVGGLNDNTGGGMVSLGIANVSSGASSVAIGFRVKSSASQSYTIGRSITNADYLENNVADSFGVGWGELTPTVLFAKTANQYINGSGNLGIGLTNPSEKLDVSGKTKTTQLQVTSGAVSGYVLTSDASGNATWQNKDPYLEYRALITQTGATAPSESILANTLTGGTWSYSDIGSYYFTKTNAFSAASKVEVYMNNTIVLSYAMSNSAFNIYSINRLDDDNIEVRTSTWATLPVSGGTQSFVTPPGSAVVSDAMSDDLLYNTLVSIRVWL